MPRFVHPLGHAIVAATDTLENRFASDASHHPAIPIFAGASGADRNILLVQPVSDWPVETIVSWGGCGEWWVAKVLRSVL